LEKKSPTDRVKEKQGKGGGKKRHETRRGCSPRLTTKGGESYYRKGNVSLAVIALRSKEAPISNEKGENGLTTMEKSPIKSTRSEEGKGEGKSKSLLIPPQKRRKKNPRGSAKPKKKGKNRKDTSLLTVV